MICPKAKLATHCLIKLFPVYHYNHWTIWRRDDCSIDPSSHCIILKIVRFLDLKSWKFDATTSLFYLFQTQKYRSRKETALSNGQLGIYRNVRKLIFPENPTTWLKLTKLCVFLVAWILLGLPKVLVLVKVIYPKYSKPWTVAHTIDCVCSKMLNHSLNHRLFLSLSGYTLPHTLNSICVSLFKFHMYLNFKAIFSLPRHIKV